MKAGAVSATSSSDGTYKLTNVVPDARVIVVAEASNHAQSVKIAAAAASSTTVLDIKLLKVGATVQLVQASGGVASVPGSVAQVSLPTNFAARADGTAPVGPVTVKITPIATANDSSFMPGDFTTVTGTGTASIESFGALTVTLTDSTGAALNLATGKTATIRIPVSTRTPGPLSATIPLFYMSVQTGRWLQEGSATLQGTAPNQYYDGTVTHFSTWNADQIVDSVVITGCVKDENGLPVAGVSVQSDGIDYSGTSSALSDATGTFKIGIKKSSRATLGGFLGSKFTNEISAGPGATDFNVATCLTLATAANSVKIKLTWGADPSDVDSYLTLPTGEVIYYGNEGNLLSAPFVSLDVDDTTSFGPEIVTIRKLMVGTYKYAVRNFSATHNPGITGSPTKVELLLNGNTSIYAPPGGENTAGETVWSVFNLTVGENCIVTVTLDNTWSLVEPITSPGPAARFCTAP